MSKYVVGDWWRTRAGRYVQIEYINRSKDVVFPVQVTDGTLYTLEGAYYERGADERDLVQKMKPPVWEPAVPPEPVMQIAEHWEDDRGVVWLILNTPRYKEWIDNSSPAWTVLVERVDQDGRRRGAGFRTQLRTDSLIKQVKFETKCSVVKVDV